MVTVVSVEEIALDVVTKWCSEKYMYIELHVHRQLHRGYSHQITNIISNSSR